MGAALAWALINLVQLFILPFVFHHRILNSELKRWYIFDMGIPVVLSLTILSLARWLMPMELSILQYVIAIGLITFTLLGVLIFSAKEVRLWAIELGKKYFPEYLGA